MGFEWTALSDEAQLALARRAAHRAVSLIASQAEQLAQNIEAGVLSDLGGAEALRLLIGLVRLDEPEIAVGNA